MHHFHMPAPGSKPNKRPLATALLLGAALFATTASAIPVQYTLTVLSTGVYLASPTAAPVTLSAAPTKLVVTVETDAAVAAIPPSATTTAQVYPVRSASMEISGTIHPLDLSKIGLASLGSNPLTSGSARAVYLAAFDSTTPPTLPLVFPNPVSGSYQFIARQPADLTVDPLPLTQAGIYQPFAAAQYPGSLPFTDGASLTLTPAPLISLNPPTAPVWFWEVKLLPTTKPFSYFKPVATKNNPESLVAVAAGLTLATDTNGINPAAEVVTLSVGSYSVTVPVGGFKKGRTAIWTYTTPKVAGIQRRVVLTQAGAGTYVLAATLDDTTAGLAGVLKGAAADVTLQIGDDVGTANVIVR